MRLIKKYNFFSDIDMDELYFDIKDLMYAFEILTFEHDDIAMAYQFFQVNNCVLPTSYDYSQYRTEIMYPKNNKENETEPIIFGFKFKAKKGNLDITITSIDKMYDVYSGNKMECINIINDKIGAVTGNKLKEQSKSIIDHVTSYFNGSYDIPKQFINEHNEVFKKIDQEFSNKIIINKHNELEISFKINEDQVQKIYDEVNSQNKERSYSFWTFLDRLLDRISTLYIDEHTANVLFDFNITARVPGEKQIVHIENVPAFSIPGIIEFLAKLFR
ncbi:MAG: hypothetical protein QXF12_03980 [Candidatus Aenigmatarchaeota archaeon]